ncbi:MAG: protein FxsA, partial [Solirubrobacterales bacterium]|nr:protein FxsA [Solirubrobacterales bacterium]
MPFLLIVLFIVVPVAELYVIIKVGEAIGIVPTLLLLLLDAILGSLLLRHQGRGAWRRFNEAIAQRRFP